MNKKRLYIVVPSLLFCTLAFSQHPHSQGGSPIYWALVGAISYGGFYIIYLLFGYLIKFAKRYKTKEQSSNMVLNSEIISPSSETLKETDTVEMMDSLQNDMLKKEENLQLYCRFCGKQINEDDVFCPRCGKKQNITKNSWSIESLSGQAKTFSHKLLTWVRVPYDYAKKSILLMSKERSNLWRKRMIRAGKILFAVIVVAIILAGGAWGYSYYYDNYLPQKQLDEACQDIINKFHSNDKAESLEYSRKILLNSWAFYDSPQHYERMAISGNSESNKKETWGYDNVANSRITERMSQYRQEAFKKIEIEAYNGNPQMQYLLGRMYLGMLKYKGFDIYETEYAVIPDTVKAVYWWNEAAKQDYTPAYNSMGIAYKLGLGVDVDLKKAIDYLKKGAESGDAKAQCNYGDLFRDGVKIHIGSHIVKEPQYIYGHYYGTENVTIQDSMVILPKDIEQALFWWKKSEAQGNAIAKERLQKIYE